MSFRQDCLQRVRSALGQITKESFILVADDRSLTMLTSMMSTVQLLQMRVSTIEKLSLKRKRYTRVQAVYIIHPTSYEQVLADFKDEPQYESVHIFSLTTIPPQMLSDLAREGLLAQRIKTLKELNLNFTLTNDNEVCLSSPLGVFEVDIESTVQELQTVVVGMSEFSTVGIFFDKNAEKVGMQLQKRLEGMFRTYERCKNECYNEQALHTNVIVLSRNFDPISPLARDFHYKPLLYEVMKVKNNKVEGKKDILSNCDEVFRKYKQEHLVNVLKGLPEDLEKFNKSTKMHSNKELKMEEMAEIIKIMPNYLQTRNCYAYHVQSLEKITYDMEKSKLKELTLFEQTAIFGVGEDGKKTKPDFLNKYIQSAMGSSAEEKARMGAIALLTMQLKPSQQNELKALFEQKYKKLPSYLTRFKEEAKKLVAKKEKQKIILDRFQCKLQEIVRSILNDEQVGLRHVRVGGSETRVNRATSKTSSLGRKKIVAENQIVQKGRVIVVMLGAMGYNQVSAMEQFQSTHRIVCCSHHFVTPQQYVQLLLKMQNEQL